MKYNVQYIFFILFSTFLYSCSDKKISDLHITIVAKEKLAEKPSSRLPDPIIKFVELIELDNMVYQPIVTVNRLDLPKEAPVLINIPKQIVNEIRNYFGTYVYEDLISDYEKNLPKMLAGEYLSKNGVPDKSIDYSSNLEDSVYYLYTNGGLAKSNEFVNVETLHAKLVGLLHDKSIGSETKIVIILNWNNPYKLICPNDITINRTDAPIDLRAYFDKSIHKDLIFSGTNITQNHMFSPSTNSANVSTISVKYHEQICSFDINLAGNQDSRPIMCPNNITPEIELDNNGKLICSNNPTNFSYNYKIEVSDDKNFKRIIDSITLNRNRFPISAEEYSFLDKIANMNLMYYYFRFRVECANNRSISGFSRVIGPLSVYCTSENGKHTCKIGILK